MTLAKCHKCGVELIAPYDGQPYWCTECSIEEEEDYRERETPPEEVQKLTPEDLKELDLADDVRCGQIITSGNQPEDQIFKGIFIGKNFHLYKKVNRGRGHGGDFYKEDGYIHVWGNIIDETYHQMPPKFVPLRPKKE
jgi:hypothetical protein